MDDIRLGLLCPAEIAMRRFLPAQKKIERLVFAGVGVWSKSERGFAGDLQDDEIEKKRKKTFSKAEDIVESYGGRIFESYNEMVASPEIDAVYIPLPPALHFEWAKKALINGKHVLLEKPFTTSLNDTKELINLSEKNDCAIQENYMFVFHKQLQEIRDWVDDGEVGRVRLIRMDFGFPKRGEGDFRYNKSMGGGALFDAGGYVIKYASDFLGDTADIVCSTVNYEDDVEVDLYGSGTMKNADGKVVQFSYGMDNEYRCSVNVWGSKGTMFTNRIFTAPSGFKPELTLIRGGIESKITLSEDDSFYNSLLHWCDLIDKTESRSYESDRILRQSEFIEKFIRKTGEKLC